MQYPKPTPRALKNEQPLTSEFVKRRSPTQARRKRLVQNDKARLRGKRAENEARTVEQNLFMRGRGKDCIKNTGCILAY